MMTTADDLDMTASERIRQTLCDVINESGLSPVVATLDNLSYFSELFVADLLPTSVDRLREVV